MRPLKVSQSLCFARINLKNIALKGRQVISLPRVPTFLIPALHANSHMITYNKP